MSERKEKDNKMHLGFSELTGRIYLGRQNGNVWVGDKRDITSEFLQIMLQKFTPKSMSEITIEDKVAYKIIVANIDDAITVNGKKI